MFSDESIHEAIRRLVGEEPKVRAEHAEKLGHPAAQVRALRAAGGNPETATVRPATQVQTYRQ